MDTIGVEFGVIDWTVVALYFIVVLVVGMIFGRRASKSIDNFFLASRSLPWWLTGTSLAATFFAADTPLFHTANVRRFGMDTHVENIITLYEGAHRL